jgi:hypothetical protein
MTSVSVDRIDSADRVRQGEENGEVLLSHELQEEKFGNLVPSRPVLTPVTHWPRGVGITAPTVNDSGETIDENELREQRNRELAFRETQKDSSVARATAHLREMTEGAVRSVNKNKNSSDSNLKSPEVLSKYLVDLDSEFSSIKSPKPLERRGRTPLATPVHVNTNASHHPNSLGDSNQNQPLKHPQNAQNGHGRVTSPKASLAAALLSQLSRMEQAAMERDRLRQEFYFMKVKRQVEIEDIQRKHAELGQKLSLEHTRALAIKAANDAFESAKKAGRERQKAQTLQGSMHEQASILYDPPTMMGDSDSDSATPAPVTSTLNGEGQEMQLELYSRVYSVVWKALREICNEEEVPPLSYFLPPDGTYTLNALEGEVLAWCDERRIPEGMLQPIADLCDIYEWNYEDVEYLFLREHQVALGLAKPSPTKAVSEELPDYYAPYAAMSPYMPNSYSHRVYAEVASWLYSKIRMLEGGSVLDFSELLDDILLEVVPVVCRESVSEAVFEGFLADLVGGASTEIYEDEVNQRDNAEMDQTLDALIFSVVDDFCPEVSEEMTYEAVFDELLLRIIGSECKPLIKRNLQEKESAIVITINDVFADFCTEVFTELAKPVVIEAEKEVIVEREKEQAATRLLMPQGLLSPPEMRRDSGSSVVSNRKSSGGSTQSSGGVRRSRWRDSITIVSHARRFSVFSNKSDAAIRSRRSSHVSDTSRRLSSNGEKDSPLVKSMGLSMAEMAAKAAKNHELQVLGDQCEDLSKEAFYDNINDSVTENKASLLALAHNAYGKKGRGFLRATKLWPAVNTAEEIEKIEKKPFSIKYLSSTMPDLEKFYGSELPAALKSYDIAHEAVVVMYVACKKHISCPRCKVSSKNCRIIVLSDIEEALPSPSPQRQLEQAPVSPAAEPTRKVTGSGAAVNWGEKSRLAVATGLTVDALQDNTSRSALKKLIGDDEELQRQAGFICTPETREMLVDMIMDDLQDRLDVLLQFSSNMFKSKGPGFARLLKRWPANVTQAEIDNVLEKPYSVKYIPKTDASYSTYSDDLHSYVADYDPEFEIVILIVVACNQGPACADCTKGWEHMSSVLLVAAD